jgi:tetratricopeptide (TPR) repeat protein
MRGWVWAAALLAVVVGCSREQTGSEAPPMDPEKQQVVEFWASFRKANQLRMAGDYAGAAAAYRECLKSNPAHEDSLFYLGASLEHLGEYAGAIAAYEHLLEVNPASSRALAQLGRLLASAETEVPIDFARARGLLERLRELNPEQAGPFLHLGLLDLREGNLDAALEEFRIAARFGAPEGHYWAGCALSLKGEGDAASEHLHKVLEVHAREQKLAGAGVRAEGDVRKSSQRPMTALERAALGSKRLLERMKAGRTRLPDCFVPASP